MKTPPTYPVPPPKLKGYRRPFTLLFEGDPVGRRLRGGWVVDSICNLPGMSERFGSALEIVRPNGKGGVLRTTCSAYYLRKNHPHYIEPEETV